jgi:cobalt-zinc-cadmium efflux system outer membrane protein
MKHYLIIGVITLLISTSFGYAEQNDTILENYIQQALTDNPSLKAALSRVEAFDQRIPQAGALPDPVLGVGVANLPINSFSFDQEPMTGKWVSLGQMFPFPGKLGLKQDIAEDQRDNQYAMMEGEKSKLIRQVKETYYNWAYIQESIQIVESNRALMDQFVDIALSKYKVGTGLQQDVLRAQTERTKYEDRLLNLHQMEATLKARLNTLLNRSADADLEAPAVLKYQPATIERDTVLAMISSDNPRIRSLRAQQQQSDSEIRLAKKSYYPDVMLGAQYTQRDDAPDGTRRYDFFSLKAEIPIPLYWKSKQNHLLEQKRIEQRQTYEEFQSLTKDLEFESTDLFNQAKCIQDQIAVYQDGIIPQAQQTLSSAMAGYQVGKVDFLTLLTSQIALFNYQLEAQQKVLEYNLAWSRIEALTGQRIL